MCYSIQKDSKCVISPKQSLKVCTNWLFSFTRLSYDLSHFALLSGCLDGCWVCSGAHLADINLQLASRDHVDWNWQGLNPDKPPKRSEKSKTISDYVPNNSRARRKPPVVSKTVPNRAILGCTKRCVNGRFAEGGFEVKTGFSPNSRGSFAMTRAS